MDCKENKRLNPKTCIYVKHCKSGYKRNKYFRCVKTKKRKSANKSVKNKTKHTL
jgi:hypothetical protein